MREILFRGKCFGRLHKKGFVYGSLGVIDTDLAAIYQCKEFTEDVRFIVDIGTVGQYTGLTDKNGTKIFEGDIVLHDFGAELIGKQIAIVKYDPKYASFMIEPVYDWMYCDKADCEVIGNIHDNPELLKEREK